MSYGIIRIQKFGASAVKGIEIHDQRKKEVSHRNPDIDRSKTQDNYVLQGYNNFSSGVKARIQELDLKKAPRKDAVVMCQALITSDKEFFDRLPPDGQKVFFQDALKFVKSKYGTENIISATVHLDEKTPHLHVNFVPVTDDGRLSAKSLLTRESLRNLQTDFFKEVGQKYGLERGESREDKRKHLTTEEFKIETRKARIIEIGASVIEKERKLKSREERLDTIINEVNALPLVDVNEIRAKDIEKRLLKKGFLTSEYESSGMVARRLNREFIEPLAEIAKHTHKVCYSIHEISRYNNRLEKVEEKYNALVKNLELDQIKKLERQAESFRLENKHEVELERQKRNEKKRGHSISM